MTKNSRSDRHITRKDLEAVWSVYREINRIQAAIVRILKIPASK